MQHTHDIGRLLMLLLAIQNSWVATFSAFDIGFAVAVLISFLADHDFQLLIILLNAPADHF